MATRAEMSIWECFFESLLKIPVHSIGDYRKDCQSNWHFTNGRTCPPNESESSVHARILTVVSIAISNTFGVSNKLSGSSIFIGSNLGNTSDQLVARIYCTEWLSNFPTEHIKYPLQFFKGTFRTSTCNTFIIIFF